MHTFPKTRCLFWGFQSNMVCISFSALTVESDFALTFLKQLILSQGCLQNWINRYLIGRWASLVTQRVKNLPAMQETQVWSLCWKDPLEKGMATHSSIHAWRIPWTEEPGGLQSMGSQIVKHKCVTNTFHFHWEMHFAYSTFSGFISYTSDYFSS